MSTQDLFKELFDLDDKGLEDLSAAMRLGTWFSEMTQAGAKVIAIVTEAEDGDQQVHEVDLYS